MDKVRRQSFLRGFRAGKLDARKGCFEYRPFTESADYWRGYKRGYAVANSDYSKKGR